MACTLPPDVKSKVRDLGEQINWALMRIAWTDGPRSLFRLTAKARELAVVLASEIEPVVDKMLMEGCEDVEAVQSAVDQIAELLGFTLEELEKLGDAKASVVTWLARAQQEVLYLLHRW